MAHADIRDDADVRPCHAGQRRDLPEPLHPHLDDGRLGRAVEAEEGLGEPDLVIEVALRLEGPVGAGEHVGDHLLGGRLADASGDPHAADGEFGAVGLRDLHQRALGVLHVEHGAGAVVAPLVRDCRRGAQTQGGGDEVVPVEPLPLERHEEAALRQAPGVGRDHVDRAGIAPGTADRPRDLIDRHAFHCVTPFVLPADPAQSVFRRSRSSPPSAPGSPRGPCPPRSARRPAVRGRAPTRSPRSGRG